MWMGFEPSTNFGDLVTADHETFTVENESRGGHKNSLIVQDEFANRIQGYPMKTKDTSETMVCLQRFSLRRRNQKQIYRQFKRID